MPTLPAWLGMLSLWLTRFLMPRVPPCGQRFPRTRWGSISRTGVHDDESPPEYLLKLSGDERDLALQRGAMHNAACSIKRGPAKRAYAHDGILPQALWLVKCQDKGDAMMLSRCHTLATMRQPSGPSTNDS